MIVLLGTDAEQHKGALGHRLQHVADPIHELSDPIHNRPDMEHELQDSTQLPQQRDDGVFDRFRAR
ncbi:hypothetical protein SAMN05421776_1338 [Nocardia farcinica]|uniref:Uncharacterized protein n=1 Tax=Nocardia farcinica TaxID=37329 RepID=A0A0H5PAB6_NOCFR|nr:hypothetical protein [Nocardia farcinica]SLH06652.1 Uncharacterised protein [Mycobacteroides abscessus subsp. abscessus]AXK90070.1 hypothetical protein DXT66_30230 [Nocardia farcinica]PFW98501.1 hypothetical protein CJ469_06147 [Nocardia farcinica]PFX02604.1 hypothetical protein CJ468_05856 [Nocardia farcinica]CRY84647.1 Uncharacterised protein [Nocardia farcinica]